MRVWVCFNVDIPMCWCIQIDKQNQFGMCLMELVTDTKRWANLVDVAVPLIPVDWCNLYFCVYVHTYVNCVVTVSYRMKLNASLPVSPTHRWRRCPPVIGWTCGAINRTTTDERRVQHSALWCYNAVNLIPPCDVTIKFPKWNCWPLIGGLTLGGYIHPGGITPRLWYI